MQNIKGVAMLGIYGGTFDPIHFGHLRTAVEVKDRLGLDELRFLPCRLPPHREQPGASPTQRTAMLELALSGLGPGIALDRRELERDGPSYMVDTLASLREEGIDGPLVLILGLDAFRALPSWHQWRRLLELAHIAVMRRPNVGEPHWQGDLAELMARCQAQSPADLQSSAAGSILLLEVTQLDISATSIRHLIAKGKSPRFLLPDPVLAMITEQGIYHSPG